MPIAVIAKLYLPLIPTLQANSRFAAAANFSLSEALRSEKRTFASTSLILLTVALAAAMRKERVV